MEKNKGRLKMTDEQKAVLLERYADTRTAELAQEFGVGYFTVSRWARVLGLTKSEDFRKGVSSVATVGFVKRYGGKVGQSRHIKLDDVKREYMRKYFATTLTPVLAETMGVNVRTVRRWAKIMGLKKDREVIQMHKTATQRPTPEKWFQIVATISELYPDGRDKEAARLTGYSKIYIGVIARKYNIRRSEAYLRAVQEKKKQVLDRRKYSPEFISSVAEYFPTHTDRECAEHFGLSKATIQGIARAHGMTKCPDHMGMIRLSNIKAAQKANEKNNPQGIKV